MAYEDFAELYDRLIADCPYDEWTEFIVKHAPQAHSAVDGACGTGNITLRLVEHFRDVTAFDLSEEMLGIAAKKLRKAGRHVALSCQDLTDFKLMRPTELFTVCCDGINYLVEDGEAERCFALVYQALTSDGVFIFDISTEHKLRNMDGQMYGSDDEEIAYIWQNSAEGDLLELSLSFFIKEKTDGYRRVDEYQCQRIYTEKEIEEMLRRQGFTDIEKYDSYTESPPSADSQRITYCARKRR